MLRIALCALLFMSTGLAQQARQNQSQNPGSTNPGNTQQPRQPAPDQQDKAETNSQIQSNIQSAISSDAVLSGAQVQASVDDSAITLAGTVQTQAQLDRVLALVSPYAHFRKVVNKMTIR